MFKERCNFIHYSVRKFPEIAYRDSLQRKFAENFRMSSSGCVCLLFLFLCLLAPGYSSNRNNGLLREILPGIGAFTYNSSSLSWKAAEKHCRVNRREMLAFPRTDQEAEVMKRLLKANAVTQVHAGFHDLYTEGAYYTLTGVRVNDSCYKNWTGDNPGTFYNYGAFSDRGLTIQSGTPLPFICVNYNFFKDDFDFIPGHGYYKAHRAHRSWVDAQQTCESEGARLLLLNSQAEFEALNVKYGDLEVWVGVHQVFTTNDFSTITGESLSSMGFSQWASGEPSGTNTEKPYVAVNLTMGQFGGLYVYTIADANMFICEMHQNIAV